jgi:hypothetical protein
MKWTVYLKSWRVKRLPWQQRKLPIKTTFVTKTVM